MNHRVFSDTELDGLFETNETFWKKLDEESDLGVVFVSSAYFENKLEMCIRRYLLAGKIGENFLAPQGPAGPFGARIDLSYCLRIIDERQHASLRKLARIRNSFAHDLSASFKNTSIRDKVWDYAKTYLSDSAIAMVSSSKKFSETRELFTLTSFKIGMDLSHRDIDVWIHVRHYGDIIPDHLEMNIDKNDQQ